MSHRSSTGCIYMYEASQAITIDAVDQYHPVIGLGENGCNNGVTYQAHSTGSITSTSNSGGLLRCVDALHGLTTGQYIALTGMGDAAHVGFTQVTVVDVNTFDCDDISYNSVEDTGTWTMGSQLIVDSGHGGIYNVQFSATISSAGTNKNYKFEFIKNTTSEDTIVAERKIAVANDLGSLSSGGLIALTGDDSVWVAVECTTDNTNLTIEHMNVHMVRV